MTDRGLSTVVSYVLTLGITTMLVGGLLLGAGNAVEGQQQNVAREELRVVGQQLASRLLAADRLVQAGGEQVRVEYAPPSAVAGSDYRIEISDGGPATIYLNATDVDVSVSVSVPVDTDLVDATLQGGEVEIVLTGGDLEVRAA
jgi:hypothetical protein